MMRRLDAGCLDKDGRNDCPAEVSGKLVGQGSCKADRGVVGRHRACGFSKGRGGSGSGVLRNQQLIRNIVELEYSLAYKLVL